MTQPLHEGTLEEIVSCCADELSALAVAYPTLFAYKLPVVKDSGPSGNKPGSKPPVDLAVVHLISEVEQLSVWGEEAVCQWLNRPYYAYLREPFVVNVRVVEALCIMARDLPEAATYAGSNIMHLAAAVSRQHAAVNKLTGGHGAAEILPGECPGCGSLDTVVRIYTPNRLRCVIPSCGHEQSLDAHDGGQLDAA
jgi:hypothetical protein